MTFDLDLGVKVTRNVVQYPLHHVTYPVTKFEVATSKRLGGDTFTKKKHYMTFDLDLGVKATQSVAQYPLHHVTYSTTKFAVATSKDLGGDTFTRNVADGRTDARTDRRTDDGPTLTRNKYNLFSKEKGGYNKNNNSHGIGHRKV